MPAPMPAPGERAVLSSPYAAAAAAAVAYGSSADVVCFPSTAVFAMVSGMATTSSLSPASASESSRLIFTDGSTSASSSSSSMTLLCFLFLVVEGVLADLFLLGRICSRNSIFWFVRRSVRIVIGVTG